MSIFRIKSNMHEALLQELKYGIEFKTNSSIIPNKQKLDNLISYAMSNTTKLPSICSTIQKKIISSLPKSSIAGYVRNSSQHIIPTTTLYDIRKCTFYINILRAIIVKCKSIGIVNLISDITMNVIIRLMNESHEEYLKLFYPIYLDFIPNNSNNNDSHINSNSNSSNDSMRLQINNSDQMDSIDYTILIEPLLKICDKEFNSTLPIYERQKLGFDALKRLIEVTMIQVGQLEVHYGSIFSTIMDNICLESFDKNININVNTSVNQGPEEATMEERNISDVSIECLKRLASTNSIASNIALVNTIIFYFDEYGWIHNEMVTQVFLCINMVGLTKNNIAIPSIQYMISHANYIATNELAENITKAEKCLYKRKNMKSKKLSNNDSNNSNNNSHEIDGLNQPGLIAIEYVETILEITANLIEKQSISISNLSQPIPNLNKILTYHDINKNLYHLSHLLWMCITWKTFYINSTGNTNTNHEIILSTINYPTENAYIPMVDPSCIEENHYSNSNSNSNSHDNSKAMSEGGGGQGISMSGVITQIWRCMTAISIHNFPSHTHIQSKVLPSLIQVLQDKVHGIVETPGVRLDLLIPAKNAMFTFVLHAIHIVLVYQATSLVGVSMIRANLSPITGDIICEFALLLRSRQWLNQKLACTVLYQFFRAIEVGRKDNYEESSVNKVNSNSNSNSNNIISKIESGDRRINRNLYAPFDEKHVIVLRDAIFNALCTRYHPHQPHATVCLFHVQISMLRAFGIDELISTIPIIMALEEFWHVYTITATTTTTHQTGSPTSSHSTNTLISSSANGGHDNTDDGSLEMIRCLRCYFLAYFLFLSKEYNTIALEKFVIHKLTLWDENKGLSKFLALDSSNGMLIVNDERMKEMMESHYSSHDVSYGNCDRIHTSELIIALLQSPKLQSSTTAIAIRQAFEIQYHPQEDPFQRFDELQIDRNISKTLFDGDDGDDDNGNGSNEDDDIIPSSHIHDVNIHDRNGQTMNHDTAIRYPTGMNLLTVKRT